MKIVTICCADHPAIVPVELRFDRRGRGKFVLLQERPGQDWQEASLLVGDLASHALLVAIYRGTTDGIHSDLVGRQEIERRLKPTYRASEGLVVTAGHYFSRSTDRVFVIWGSDGYGLPNVRPESVPGLAMAIEMSLPAIIREEPCLEAG